MGAAAIKARPRPGMSDTALMAGFMPVSGRTRVLKALKVPEIGGSKDLSVGWQLCAPQI